VSHLSQAREWNALSTFIKVVDREGKVKINDLIKEFRKSQKKGNLAWKQTRKFISHGRKPATLAGFWS
jgi:hypothetical protein